MSLRPRARLAAAPPGRLVTVHGSLTGPAVGLRSGARLPPSPAPAGLSFLEAGEKAKEAWDDVMQRLDETKRLVAEKTGDEARKDWVARMNGLTSLAERSLTDEARQLLRSLRIEKVERGGEWDSQTEQIREFAQEVMQNATKVAKRDVLRVITQHAQIYETSDPMRARLLRVVEVAYDLVQAASDAVTARLELDTATDKQLRAGAALEHQKELVNSARGSYERLSAEERRLTTLLKTVTGSPGGDPALAGARLKTPLKTATGSPDGQPAQAGDRDRPAILEEKLDAIVAAHLEEKPAAAWSPMQGHPGWFATDDRAVAYYETVDPRDSVSEAGVDEIDVQAIDYWFATCMDSNGCAEATYINRESMKVLDGEHVQWYGEIYRMISTEEDGEGSETRYVFVRVEP